MEFKEVSSQTDTSLSSYGDGGFRIGELRIKGSVLITPKGYYPWDVKDVSITYESLARILDQKDDIDILLIGTGENMFFLDKALKGKLETGNFSVDVMATGAAARTYNILLSEGRKVAAALIAVD
ncbi:MAG: Mth938-like domain-containing protein [Emcibacter sp.]|nr:Mth938-like domain-containing protein [Emcibacter sp.]